MSIFSDSSHPETRTWQKLSQQGCNGPKLPPLPPRARSCVRTEVQNKSLDTKCKTLQLKLKGAWQPRGSKRVVGDSGHRGSKGGFGPHWAQTPHLAPLSRGKCSNRADEIDSEPPRSIPRPSKKFGFLTRNRRDFVSESTDSDPTRTGGRTGGLSLIHI